MLFRDVILPELYNWSISTEWLAVLLIVFAAIVLIKMLVSRQIAWWQTLLLVGIVVIGTWSFVIGLNFYQLWLHYIGNAPEHGMMVYYNNINDSYVADVQRCELQFAITAMLFVLVLLFVGWSYLRSVKTRERGSPLKNSFVRANDLQET